MSSVLYSDNYVANQFLDRGIAHLRENRFCEAVVEFDKNLSLTPNDPYAHWNKATALLSMGDYENGFIEHDWGWKLFDWRGFGPINTDEDCQRLRQLPVWQGSEDISDKRLLVYHELGFGDAIMTMRYLPELKRLAEHVTLIVPHPLVGLANQFGIEVLECLPNDLYEYDFRLPLFGVLSVLHQTLTNIPRASYIDAEWKRNGNCVGVAWSGRTQTVFNLDYFLSMFKRNGFSLFSLQTTTFQPGKGIERLSAETFFDTIKLIEKMDHIVTIDTAAAHLAGAMGHPSVHLLLPFMMDWRWWHSEVWYPTIKTYHQDAPDDWSGPFERLNAALKG
jgi:hypothetical protein